jgi:hypothetical protein
VFSGVDAIGRAIRNTGGMSAMMIIPTVWIMANIREIWTTGKPGKGQWNL